MLSVEWSSDKGWGKPEIAPVKNLSIHPAAKVLHYAVEIFDGFKAYHADDGTVRIFRPERNIARFHKSAMRSVLPSFDQRELLNCIKKLISIEKEWIPKTPLSSLYIRPTLIGTEVI
jgi:branched-chain amino acid aminotransferase